MAIMSGASRKILHLALTLVLSAWASRETCELGEQCSGEAQVSIERTGPHGTFAGDREMSLATIGPMVIEASKSLMDTNLNIKMR
jgi:hypothetical protein